jgi:hypothetical protein
VNKYRLTIRFANCIFPELDFSFYSIDKIDTNKLIKIACLHESTKGNIYAQKAVERVLCDSDLNFDAAISSSVVKTQTGLKHFENINSVAIFERLM